MFYDEASIDGLAANRMFAMGRPHGRHGFGHGGPGFLGGPGGGDFRFARKLGSKDLQLLILSLLGERPAHGYELIKTIEERSGGFYTPSPGMIYPALTYLEEIGHATVAAEGAKKLYSITDAGRQHLQENRVLADTMLHELEQIGSKMDDVRRAFSGEGARSRGDNEDEPYDPRC